MFTKIRYASRLTKAALCGALLCGGFVHAQMPTDDVAPCEPALEREYTRMNQVILDETAQQVTMINQFARSSQDEATKAAMMARLHQSAKHVLSSMKHFRTAYPSDLTCRLTTGRAEVLKLGDLDQAIRNVADFERQFH